MQSNQREIVILKPTPVFFSFLSSQVPDIELPDLNILQKDATAYAIRKYENEEAMLEEIERHFTTMFNHEISRWFGADVCEKVEGTFLDFLRCFKFEMHSQIVLMESELQSGHQLLCVKPRLVQLKWAKSAKEQQKEVAHILEEVNPSSGDLATVVVKNFNNLTQVMPFVKHYYRPLLATEFEEDNELLALESFQDFSQYFSVEIHTQLVHLH